MSLPPLHRTLAELVAIESISGNEVAIADYVCQKLERAGVNYERDELHNVTAFLGPEKGESLCLSGHLDTVPAASGWEQDPWKPTVADGVMTGLGVSDMKSGLALMLDIIDWDLSRPVILAFSTNEEGGVEGQVDGVVDFLERHRPDTALILEPTAVGEHIYVSPGCQGNVAVKFALEGRAAHSSRPERGDNALYKAAHLVAEVERLAAELKPVPLHSGMEALPVMAVTMLSGGVRHNVIPDRADVTVNRRVSPTEDMDDVVAGLKGLGPCSTAEYRGPYLLPTDDPFFSKVMAASDKVLGYADPFFFRGWVDSSLFAAAGIPAVTFGPGTQGVGHGPGESCILANLDKCREVLKELLL